MADDSQLYLWVDPCDESVVAIVERKDPTLRCSFTARGLCPPTEVFGDVMHDFKRACDLMDRIQQVEVTALSGWGLETFEDSRRALRDVFSHRSSARRPLVYSILGRYPGTRRLGAVECQTYAKVGASEYALLTDSHAL